MSDPEAEQPSGDHFSSPKGISREDYEGLLDVVVKKFGSEDDFWDHLNGTAEMQVWMPILDHMHRVAVEHADKLREAFDALSDDAKWKSLKNDPEKFSAELQRIFRSIDDEMKKYHGFVKHRPPRYEVRNHAVYKYVRDFWKREPKAKFSVMQNEYNHKHGTSISEKNFNKIYNDYAEGEGKRLRVFLQTRFPFETFDPALFRVLTAVSSISSVPEE